MITEHVVLPVIPGREADFETAFAQARTIIESMRGFLRLTLSRSIESPSSYLLLVDWERIEDHTEGFRLSPEFQRWRELLHHFYDPRPTVEHFHQVA
ncbi:antibiotic biosynthesis monooxygenase family protein [Nocardia higoensis]|uniref:antibiotic biosynthesis monooxygenase family protein n=1 Tax=Nocardia higoensis TaxID=228599 RepID=UPI0002F9CFCF|nr:antibiotic biosynthesis monooxygenase [Nocardia higoensis]